MDIVTIKELNIGDTILAAGELPNQTLIAEVDSITKQGVIKLKGVIELYYDPLDENKIIRISEVDENRGVLILSHSIRLGISKIWKDTFKFKR